MECYMPYSVVNRVKYAYINKLCGSLKDDTKPEKSS